MSQQVTYICDICGTQKKEANHWFRAVVDSSGCFTLWHWDAGGREAEDIHLCGMQCAGKAMAKAMEPK